MQSSRKIYIPNYSVEKEMWAIDEQNLTSEVSQEYEEFKEIISNTLVVNKETGKKEMKTTRRTEYIMPKTPPSPVSDPRDTHMDEFKSPETKTWAAYLENQREEFKKGPSINHVVNKGIGGLAKKPHPATKGEGG